MDLLILIYILDILKESNNSQIKLIVKTSFLDSCILQNNLFQVKISYIIKEYNKLDYIVIYLQFFFY